MIYRHEYTDEVAEGPIGYQYCPFTAHAHGWIKKIIIPTERRISTILLISEKILRNISPKKKNSFHDWGLFSTNVFYKIRLRRGQAGR